MHDLSLILGCMRSVIYFYEVNVVGNVFILFLFLRLTLEIGNFMSSHSLSAGHVPLGLGRDKVGIRALAQFMHFQLRCLFPLLLW